MSAKRAFRYAKNTEKKFRSSPIYKQTLEKYKEIISLYRKVLIYDPTYAGCDDALLRMATLARDAGINFDSKRMFKRAVDYLDWLIKEYPYSKLRDDALVMKGDICAERLNDIVQARKAYEVFLKRYSRSSKVKDVIRKINELPDKATGNKVVNYSTGKAWQPQPVRSEITQLMNVRYWSTNNYTRVVIDLDGETKFTQNEIGHPYRIFFDFKKSTISPSLIGKSFIVEGNFLYRIRVGQYRKNIARVVLDFKKQADFTVFTLYDPFRVVIDLRGRTKISSRRYVRKIKKPKSYSSKRNKVVSKGSGTLVKGGGVPAVPKPTEEGKTTLTRALGLKVGKIVIDPGHGGRDTGSIGYGGIKEKDITLAIALELRKKLERKLNVKVIMTRNRDVYVPLEQRTAIANISKADLFISIHANSSRSSHVDGVETFYLGMTKDPRLRRIAASENATSQRRLGSLRKIIEQITLYEKLNESKDLAERVQRRLAPVVKSLNHGAKNRGIKRAPFVVLIGANVPSILVEIGFISNKREALIIKQKKNQMLIADALCRGIGDYLKSLGIRTAAWTPK